MVSLIEDPVMKQRLGFQPADDGDAVLVEMWVEPGGGVPPHVHPAMEERFEVISGRAELPGGPQVADRRPGETVVVPAGHAPRLPQRGDEPAHGVCHASPASTLQEFLEDAAAMARAGKITAHGLPSRPARWSRRCAWRCAIARWS